MKNRRTYLTVEITAVALALLGLWHLLDVRAGAAAAGTGWLTGWYLFLWAVSLLGAVLAGWMFYGQRKRQWSLVRIYPAVGFGLGLLYLFVLPPMSAPDEVSHYITAYEVSSHLLGKTARAADGKVLVRAQDWFLEDMYGDYEIDDSGQYWLKTGDSGSEVLGQELDAADYQAIHDVGLEHEETRQQELLADTGEDGEVYAVSPFPPVTTTPAAYLPQAVGIALARLLHLDSLWLAYLGRLCNLAFFVGMTWLALRRLPFGQEALFGVALLPMTLHLSASFSYDVMILACMFLLTAVCLDLAYQKAAVRPVDVALIAVLLAVGGPCKMIYVPMMGLCLLIPVRKFGGWGKWFGSAAAVTAALAAAMVLVNRSVIAGYVSVAAETALTSGGEEGISLTMLLHRPGLLTTMFYNTLLHQTDEYHLTMIGAQLGNLDPVLNVPYLLVVFYTMGLLLLALRVPGENLTITGGRRIWIFVICAACAAAAMLSMLIACTPKGSMVIEGVQGRYFLPFLPVLLMACKNDRLVLTKNGNRSILYLMCCANLYVLLRLYSVICLRL